MRSEPALSATVSPSAVVLCSTAVVVATTYLLGASWLATSLLGLPIGLWLIAAVYACWRRGWLELLEASLPAIDRQRWIALSPLTQRRLAPILRYWVALRAIVSDLLIAAWNFEHRSLDDLRNCACQALDAHPELAAPVKIVIIAPEETAHAVMRHESPVPVRWRLLADADVMPAHGIDVVFRVDDIQRGLATLPEPEGTEATWFDWSIPRPLSFASVFPHQNDPAQVTIDLLPDSESDDPLVTALLVAAGVQARCPARLSLIDRLCGRIPLDGIEQPGAIDPGAFRVRAMRRLAQILAPRDPAQATVLERMAAAVVSAWLVTPAARIPMIDRRSLMEDMARFLADRPETWLRLAAIRFANLDDEAAIDALLRADPLVRAHADQLVLDQHAFVQSEMDLGGAGSLTLGRICAGVCLLAAQHDYEQLDFLRDDLIEDLRYAGWFVGRDQDAVVLYRVIRELTRVRRAESRGLPAIGSTSDRHAA
ncbi:MAG: hypothetical protein D6695_10170 [Planctomycetota bacterium]|nr:MAG: hypothetical protein D6695_10170 [Planctomycetota bacterium]